MTKESTLTLDPIVVRLRDRRSDIGVSQERLAVRAGGAFSASSIRNYERGRAMPNLRTLREWAAALGCDLDVTVSEGLAS